MGNCTDIGKAYGRCRENNFKSNNYINEIKVENVIEPKIKELIPQTKTNNISKSICRIKIETNIYNQKGIGFFLNFYIGQECFYCLILNKKVTNNKKNIKVNNIIVYYEDGSKYINIRLNQNNRFIKSFEESDLDITVIEIIKDDNITENYFLFPVEENISNNKLIDNKIYISQYQEGKELFLCKGKIQNISKDDFIFMATTQEGLLGNPIFLQNNIKVIGIQGNNNRYGKHGYFIYPLINKIKKNIKMKRKNSKYINGEYIYEYGKFNEKQFKATQSDNKITNYYSNESILYRDNYTEKKIEEEGKNIYKDGKIYIGHFINGLRNGRGIMYYSDGNILYDGNWFNDKYEGNGKFIWEDDDYYIGLFKNGLREGEGIQYYSDGSIAYQGDYYNDKAQGNGKFFWKDGSRYEGQFKNGLIHGKGKYFNSKGIMVYDGDFINGERQGNGKYNYDNGEFYIGEWKNDLRNGNGIQYYSDNTILYEGNWVNDKYKGNGKYITEEGYYYIGIFKDDLPNGNGKLFDINGKIIYEGEWLNGKYEGKGQYYYEDGYYIGDWKNDLRNGNGILYDLDGKIECEGKWLNDEFIGK